MKKDNYESDQQKSKNDSEGDFLSWFMGLSALSKIIVITAAAYIVLAVVGYFSSNGDNDLGKPSFSKADKTQLCKKYIAGLFGRSVSSMQVKATHVDSAGGFFAEIYYRRPSDNTRWENTCHIYDKTILWAALNSDGSLGRWRYEDEKRIYFKKTNDTYQPYFK